MIGWVAQAFGPRWTLIIGGGLSSLGAALAGLIGARRRGLSIRPRLLPRPRIDIITGVEESVTDGPLVEEPLTGPVAEARDSGQLVRGSGRAGPRTG